MATGPESMDSRALQVSGRYTYSDERIHAAGLKLLVKWQQDTDRTGVSGKWLCCGVVG